MDLGDLVNVLGLGQAHNDGGLRGGAGRVGHDAEMEMIKSGWDGGKEMNERAVRCGSTQKCPFALLRPLVIQWTAGKYQPNQIQGSEAHVCAVSLFFSRSQ